MIKTIILDLDGPILDGRLRHYQCYSDILRENDFVPMSFNEYWAMKRNRLDRRKQLAASGAEGIYDQFLQTWLERIEDQRYLSLDCLQPGVLQRLNGWRLSGIRLILASLRNNKAHLDWQLDSLSLSPLLDHVLAAGTEEGVAGKVEAVKKYIGPANAASIIWIGDTEVDIRAACMLGIRVCAVSCGLRTAEYLSGLGPDLLVADLREIDIKRMETL